MIALITFFDFKKTMSEDSPLGYIGQSKNFSSINVESNIRTDTLDVRSGMDVQGSIDTDALRVTSGVVELGPATLTLSAPTAANYPITLPEVQGAAGETVLNDGAGVLTWGTPGGGGGGVSGPVSSTDNALARYDGVAGDTIQDSLAVLSDTGALTGLTSIDINGTNTGIVTNTGGGPLLLAPTPTTSVAIGNAVGAMAVSLSSGTGDLSLSSTDQIFIAADGVGGTEVTGALDVKDEIGFSLHTTATGNPVFHTPLSLASALVMCVCSGNGNPNLFTLADSTRVGQLIMISYTVEGFPGDTVEITPLTFMTSQGTLSKATLAAPGDAIQLMWTAGEGWVPVGGQYLLA